MVDKKEKPIDVVKKYIADHGLILGNLIGGNIVGKLSNQFFSIHEKGFDIYTVDSKRVKSMESFSWSDFNHAEVDRMAISVRIKFTGTKPIHISVPSLHHFSEYLKSNNIEISFLTRKWYQKILGFRSGKKWKMVTACISYFLILIFIIALFTPSDDDSTTKDSGSSKTAQTATQPAKSEAKEKTKATAKVPVKKLSTEDKIKAALQANNTFDKTNDFNNKSSIIDFNYNKDNGFVFARVYGHDGLTTNFIKKGMWINTTDLLKRIKPMKEVKEIAINITFPMQDAYGKKSNDTIMKLRFKRETINKIDFNNFLTTNIPVVADEYWQHPSFNK
jgi:uncharacterized membrane protein YkoI